MKTYEVYSFIRDGKYFDYAGRSRYDLADKYLKVLSKVLKPKEDIIFAYIGNVIYPGVKQISVDWGFAFNLVLFTDSRMLIGSRHIFKKTIISVPYDCIDPLAIRTTYDQVFRKGILDFDTVVVPTKRGKFYFRFDRPSYGSSSASKAVELMALAVAMDWISKKRWNDKEFKKFVREYPGPFDEKTTADAWDDDDDEIDANEDDEERSSSELTEEEKEALADLDKDLDDSSEDLDGSDDGEEEESVDDDDSNSTELTEEEKALLAELADGLGDSDEDDKGYDSSDLTDEEKALLAELDKTIEKARKLKDDGRDSNSKLSEEEKRKDGHAKLKNFDLGK